MNGATETRVPVPAGNPQQEGELGWRVGHARRSPSRVRCLGGRIASEPLERAQHFGRRLDGLPLGRADAEPGAILARALGHLRRCVRLEGEETVADLDY